MWKVLLASSLLAQAGSAWFERHDIASYPAGYQVSVADINGDGKPDVIALSTERDRVDWFQNPGWTPRAVSRTAKNIDLAIHDIDGDGQLEIALASGFYFDQSHRGGEIQILFRPAKQEELWKTQAIAVDPVVHRLRWGDLDGDGRKELVHAPIFGPGSEGARNPRPAHLWALRPPQNLSSDWPIWKIDETLTVLHGLHVSDLDDDGRDEILTASFEGVHRFDFEPGGERRWTSIHISTGAVPQEQAPGTPRGSSEVAPGQISAEKSFLAAIEPWHGTQAVVYKEEGGAWSRQVIDDTLIEGHALVAADLDGDGRDEFVAGWRGGEGGLALYYPDSSGRFRKVQIDRGIKVEGIAVADVNQDGKPDLVVIAGRSNYIAWYENRTGR